MQLLVLAERPSATASQCILCFSCLPSWARCGAEFCYDDQSYHYSRADQRAGINHNWSAPLRVDKDQAAVLHDVRRQVGEDRAIMIAVVATNLWRIFECR